MVLVLLHSSQTGLLIFSANYKSEFIVSLMIISHLNLDMTTMSH